ncbi:MAG: hypothetical protein KatS3mg009_3332 [Acidimicrobiia bacterium]|nr:MAG: hypothetical protein KatS3mg009_3332 [Acidimicrobiia bacterium]
MTGTPQIVTAPALKEWAVVVHALLAGEQVVDVRKGGLREEGRHFGLPARRFWLYPTAEHQRAELLKPAYRHWVDLAAASPAGEPVTVPGWAEVTDVATVTEPEHLAALDGKEIWTLDYAASRLRWKRRDPLWVLVLRAYRLDTPLTVEWDPSYGGCTSWVTLAGLPADPGTRASQPALSDVAFEGRRKGVRDALPPECWES